jgi:undecaprenyl diphosphate synthase
MPIAPAPDGGSAVPAHVAIIMDGNGRWARARGLPRTMGHRRGAEAARGIVKAAAELGIRYLTLYSFSSENWTRPPAEVDFLMGLLRVYLRSEVAEMHSQGVRLRVIGDRTRVPADIVTLIEHAEQLTRGNTLIDVVMAFSYGSRAEIVAGVRRIAAEAASGRLDPAAVDEEMIGRALYTSDIPDPDLVVRTSGEKRLSNFLLWQAAYAELVFTDVLWPDFGRAELEAAIAEFHHRDRRYGGVGV